MKNSSPYTKDKLVHMVCAKGLGKLRDHHSETVYFSFYYYYFIFFLIICFEILFQGLTLKLGLSVWGLHESCSLLKLYLPTQ